MNCGVSCCSSWTVSRALCAGALSCWNTLPAMRRMTDSICFPSKTFKPRGSIHHRLSPPAQRRTAQCSPVLRQQRTPSATRRMLADNTAGIQERCRASSHCSPRRRDRSESWLATLRWTPSRPRRIRSRQHVLRTSEAAASISAGELCSWR